MEKETNGLVVIKLTNQKIPSFTEIKGKDYISFGDRNLYPDYIISLFERSATNNAIITGKVNYVIGDGWKGLKKGLSREAEARLNDFVLNINENETLDELSEKVVLDFEMNEGFYLEVVQTKNKKDFSLYHLPFSKMRTNEDETKFYFSKDWSEKNQSPEKTGYKEYPKFNPDKMVSNSVFYFRILSPVKGKGVNVYPLPNWIGGAQSVETEIECQNFNLSEIKTGFSAGSMINFFNGIPSNDEKDVIEEKIREKFSGTDRAGSFILNFSDGKDRGSEVISLSGNDLPERYLNLKKDSRNTILTSHKVTSGELFGIPEEGNALNGRTQIAEKYELFQNTYVKKRQRILEKIFNGFASLKGVSGRLQLKPTAAISTDTFSEQTIVQVMPRKAIQDLIAAKMGIDMTKYEPKPVVTTMKSIKPNQLIGIEFEASLLDAFGKCGRSRDFFEVIKSEEFTFKSEREFLEFELLNFEDEEDVIVSTEPVKKKRREVLFSYEWKVGFDNSDLKTSREFCKELIKKDLFYTRNEIDNLSNDFDTDVWKYKGGWYTKPDTNTHVPSCRHIWKRNVVILK